MNIQTGNSASGEQPLSFAALCKAKGFASPSQLCAALRDALPDERSAALVEALAPGGLTKVTLGGIWRGTRPPPALLLEEVEKLRDRAPEGCGAPACQPPDTTTTAEAQLAPVAFSPPADWGWDNSKDGLLVSGAEIIAVMARHLAPGELLWGVARSKDYETKWGGRPISRDDALSGGDNLAWLMQPKNANYVSMGVFAEDASGKTGENQRGIVRIVLDDVGTKAKFPDLPPTMVIETSPGNYQISYFLDGVERDIPRVKALLAELARLGLTDNGAGSTVRYFRIPGSNVKPEHNSFRDKVRVWAPERRFSLEQLAEGVGITIPAPGSVPVSAGKLAPAALLAPGADDEVRGNLVARMLKCIKNDGRFDSRDDWLNMCFAAHSACYGDPAGRHAFVDWSYGDPAEAERVWDTFKGAESLGYGYLLDRLHDDAQRYPQARRLHTELQNRRAKDVFGVFSDEQVAQISIAAARAVPEHIRKLNAEYIYVGDIDRIVRLDKHGLPATYQRREAFKVEHDNNAAHPKLGTHWLQNAERRTARTMGVYPPGTEPEGAFNLWRGLALDPKPGSWPKIESYLRNIICAGDIGAYAWLTQWIARMVQCPLERGETGVVLIGAQGTGKSTFGEMLKRMLGEHAVSHITDGRHAFGFNLGIEGKPLLWFEEAFYGHDPQMKGKLKSLVTDGTVSIEPKGVDRRASRNIAHVLITSNEIAAVPLDADDRRFTILRVSDAGVGDKTYFGELRAAIEGDELRAFGHWCLAVDLTGFDHREPYMTVAKQRMKEAVMVPELAWWLEALESGVVPGLPSETNWHRLPVTVSKDAFYRAYTQFVSERRGHVRSKAQLLDAIAGYAHIREVRPWIDKNGRKRAPWSIVLPPLDECRKRWTQRAGPRNWDADDDTEHTLTDGTDTQNDPDAI